MNANVNSITPLLSDLKTTTEKPLSNDLKNDEGPSFGSALSKAEKREIPNESPKPVKNFTSPKTQEPRSENPSSTSAEEGSPKSEKLVQAIDDKAGIVGE